MKGLFWLTAGALSGILGYRYYEQSGGRLPILEQLTGKSTDQMLDQVSQVARTAKSKAQDVATAAKEQAQDTASESAGKVARSTVAAVAEEIASAEQAKRREEHRTP